ncbi:glycosyl transferase family protein [Geoanaerobacter pelophilus]|uniref:Glycosyl transferase family protein n=1 Tax=Geoanaerobacter pelophilus TaxID=60036 RepID=A0ABQ0MIM5_9BACT|nr:glycosyltransferase [Geoanaerobacter pelophilus]GAW66657.1 glycosyl transferase family protein [Geoanaerobacter pelophilus]
MKLSVLIITYNHEKFIAQALDSVLMQTVNFDYEIVIGEDCSTDGTRDIVLAYLDAHPDKIRLLLPEKNLGMHRNFVETYRACRGEYLALLDGDDYWSSRDKLQQQVDFLDANPGCAICFHPVAIATAEDPSASVTFPEGFDRAVSTLEDLVVENFIPTCSAVARGGLITEFPEWFFSLRQGDWPFHVMNAQHGDIGFLNDTMAVYRVHAGGVWSGEKLAPRLEAIVEAYSAINDHLGRKYDHLVRREMARYYYRISRCHEEMGAVGPAREAFWKGLRSSFNAASGRERAVLALKLYAPRLYRFVAGAMQACGSGAGNG